MTGKMYHRNGKSYFITDDWLKLAREADELIDAFGRREGWKDSKITACQNIARAKIARDYHNLISVEQSRKELISVWG